MNVLLTGANGQLGQAVQKAFAGSRYRLVSTTRQQLDIAQEDAVEYHLQRYDIDVVLNAAAYTAVDRAEMDEAAAKRVNTMAAESVASAASRCGAAVVHFSTDFVFDGAGCQPYVESDFPCPLNLYGATKLAGEQRILAACERAIVLRTSWVYSEFGHNFLSTMLRLGAEKSQLAIVDDQIGCPTYAGDIATACLRICDSIREGRAEMGLFHLAGPDAMSWFEFATLIFAGAKRAGYLETPPALEAIHAAEYPTAAIRPAYSALDSSRFCQQYAVSMRPVVEVLHDLFCHQLR